MNPRLLLIPFLLCSLALIGAVGAFAQDEALAAFEMRWSPDGRWIGVGSIDGAWIFDTQDFNAEPFHYQAGSGIYIVAFDPVRPQAALAPMDDQAVRVIEIETGQTVFQSYTSPMDSFFAVHYDLDYSDDGQYLTILNGAGLYVVDAATGEQLRTGYDPDLKASDTSNWLTSLDYGADGTVLASDWNSRLLSYRLDDDAHAVQSRLHPQYGLYRFELIAETDRAVMLHGSALVTVDVTTREREALLDSEAHPIFGFDVSADGTLVAAGSDTTWYLYDLVEHRIVREYVSEFDGTAYQDRIYSLAFSPDGDQVATLQTDGQLKVWDVESGEILATLGAFTVGASQRWG